MGHFAWAWACLAAPAGLDTVTSSARRQAAWLGQQDRGL
jgi:hypothetical protein